MPVRSQRDSAPQKIVFVNRFFFPDQSATSRILSDLAFQLARLGVPVTVVSSRQLYNDPLARLPAYEVVDGITINRVSTATRGRANLAGRALDYATFYAAAAAKLLHVLSRGDVVVAKTDPPLVSIPVSWVAHARGAIFVNWLQDLFPEVAAVLTPSLMPSWVAEILTSWRDRTLRQASMNVVLGSSMGRRLRDRGVPDARIMEIPNWSDPDAIVPVASGKSETRRSLGLTDRFVVGYSGNFGRAHDFETLIGAARLLADDSAFAFLMTGAGAQCAPLQQTVRRDGLTNFVFQDYQSPERLSDSMAASDVHLVSLLPALEGLIVPSKIYGILASGRPSVFIGDPDGEIATLLAEYDCGVTVRMGDSEGLSKQLRALRHDRLRLGSMGFRARALAVSRFTSHHAASEWLSLLSRVAPAPTAGQGVKRTQ
jgi:glycosyltransferase involved in cell wall biosynthesis